MVNVHQVDYIKKVIPFNKADIHLKIYLVNSALDYDWMEILIILQVVIFLNMIIILFGLLEQ